MSYGHLLQLEGQVRMPDGERATRGSSPWRMRTSDLKQIVAQQALDNWVAEGSCCQETSKPEWTEGQGWAA